MSEDISCGGYAVFKDQPVDPDSLTWLARRFGKPELVSEIAYAGRADNPDVQFTKGSVPWHNERLYSPDSPKYLMLGCVAPPKERGRTLLLDCHLAAGALRRRDARLEKVVLRYEKCGKTRDWPLVIPHPSSGLPMLRYRQNPRGQSHVRLADGPSGMSEERVLALVDEVLESVGPAYAHEWSEGDVLVVDNFRMMHAREAYAGERKLRRVLIAERDTPETIVTDK